MPVVLGWPGNIAGRSLQLTQWMQLTLVPTFGEKIVRLSPLMTYVSITTRILSCCLGHRTMKGGLFHHLRALPFVILSDDDDTIYVVEKMAPGDDTAWVISINLRTNELLGVAKFAAERTQVVPFAFTHSRISKYLTGNSGDYTLLVHTFFFTCTQICCLAFFRKESSAHLCL